MDLNYFLCNILYKILIKNKKNYNYKDRKKDIRIN